MFLNVLYKALKEDTSIPRTLAFIKRILQVFFLFFLKKKQILNDISDLNPYLKGLKFTSSSIFLWSFDDCFKGIVYFFYFYFLFPLIFFLMNLDYCTET